MADGDITVRAARDDDDLDALNAGNSGWHGQALIRELFAVDMPEPHAIFVAELDGVPVGYGDAVAAGVADGHRGLGSVYVLPNARGRGVGSALWNRILSVCSVEHVGGILTSADVADVTSRAFAERRGLKAAGLHLESELDLARAASLAGLASPMPAGIELQLMPADASEDVWRMAVDLFIRLSADTPDFAAGSDPIPFPIFRTFLAESWQVMGAWRGEQLVGMTAVTPRDPEARRLNTWFTGVDRDVRAQGLATTLKITHAIALGEAGWRSITTQNMDNNVPILASNAKLGFRPTVGRLDLVFDHPR